MANICYGLNAISAYAILPIPKEEEANKWIGQFPGDGSSASQCQSWTHCHAAESEVFAIEMDPFRAAESGRASLTDSKYRIAFSIMALTGIDRNDLKFVILCCHGEHERAVSSCQ